jgi:predicted phosphodiesterase
MRIALLSDIHANLHALEAVGKDLGERKIDRIWSLGDVVGYGGHPREVLLWVEGHADLVVKGNHDEAVATGDVTWFNPMAAQAARAHAHRLDPTERSRIYSWPMSVRPDIHNTPLLVVHASPDDPLREYVQPQDARLALRRWEGRARMILLGHTHRPFIARLDEDPRRSWRASNFSEVIDDQRAGASPLVIVNPGSVGQPRDADPRASYAILDFVEKNVELRRVAYDIEGAAQAILKEGLDPLLALRLYEGR